MINSMAFAPGEKSAMMELLNCLTHMEIDGYNEIRISNDGYCDIVEWERIPYDHAYGGQFVYVDEEHEVFRELSFPDKHYEYVRDCEVRDSIEEWISQNPGWSYNYLTNTWEKEK